MCTLVSVKNLHYKSCVIVGSIRTDTRSTPVWSSLLLVGRWREWLSAIGAEEGHTETTPEPCRPNPITRSSASSAPEGSVRLRCLCLTVSSTIGRFSFGRISLKVRRFVPTFLREILFPFRHHPSYRGLRRHRIRSRVHLCSVPGPLHSDDQSGILSLIGPHGYLSVSRYLVFSLCLPLSSVSLDPVSFVPVSLRHTDRNSTSLPGVR